MSVLSLPIGQIAPDPANVRRTRASPADDAAMLASVKAVGVLVPILVRDDQSSGFLVIAGHRRLAAAIDAGLETIPVRIMDAWGEGALASMQAAENEVRAPMSRVDLWRAMERMQKAGMTLEKAGAAVGVDQRTARQLAKLGQVAAPILDHIATGDMPNAGYLHTIAAAPREEQLAAWQRHKPKKPGGDVSWWDISKALAVERIPQSHAEFGDDLAAKHGIIWEEDLFAPAAASLTTSQLTAFKAAQQEHVETVLVPKLQKHGLKGVVLPWGSYEVLLPAGAGRVYGITESNFYSKKATPEAVRGFAIKPGGEIVRVAYMPPAARKAVKAEGDDEQKAPRGPITAAGQRMLAEAQNKALVASLEDPECGSVAEALKLLLVALHSSNVSVARSTYARGNIGDAASQLVTPAGTIRRDIPEQDLIGMANGMVAQILTVGDGKGWAGSGPAAHWIAAYIDADACLDGMAFTTAEFLKACSLPALQAMAMPARLSSVITKAGDGRKRLEGKMVVPTFARFGAPGPKPEGLAGEDDGAALEDAA